jgi:hypothetical protein
MEEENINQSKSEIPPALDDIEDVNKSLERYIFRSPFTYMFLVISLALIVIIIFGSSTIPFQFISIICFLVIFAVSAFVSFIYKKIQNLFMKQIADKLGYGYNFTDNLLDLRGKLFEIGHDRKMQHVLSGKYLDLPIKIFNYYFTVGSGKNRRTYSYTVFETQFNTKLPDIVLLTNNFLSFFNIDTFSMINGKEKFSLEGDFNKYFKLYAPKDLEIEVLEIFTPDVMAELIDKFHGMNIEIFENKMYIYVGGVVSTKREILLMHELVSQLSKKLNKVLCDVGQDIKEGGAIFK